MTSDTAKPEAEAAIERLRAELEAGLEGVTQGPWEVFEGCSWRRIGTKNALVNGEWRREDDCAVLAPTKSQYDGHPDLTCSRGNDLHANLEHVARCSPDNIRLLLSELSRLTRELAEARKDAARYRWLRSPRHGVSNRWPHVTQYPFQAEIDSFAPPQIVRDWQFKGEYLDEAVDAAMTATEEQLLCRHAFLAKHKEPSE